MATIKARPGIAMKSFDASHRVPNSDRALLALREKNVSLMEER